jgi:long-subunit acyl-CoA synthetase (AMP-forming)
MGSELLGVVSQEEEKGEEEEKHAQRTACGLLSLGLKTGDRVGIWAPNCWEW